MHSEFSCSLVSSLSNMRWKLRLSVSLCRLYKSVNDWLKLFNAAGLWISFLKDSGWIFCNNPKDVGLYECFCEPCLSAQRWRRSPVIPMKAAQWRLEDKQKPFL